MGQIPLLASFQDEKCLEDYPKLCDNVVGFLVEFPMLFLEKEDLKISVFNKEYYIPDANFV